MERQEEIPFDSDRKLMSSKYSVHGIPTVFTKGAVDVLLARTEYIMDGDTVRTITKTDIDNILNQNRIFLKKEQESLLLHIRNVRKANILQKRVRTAMYSSDLHP